MGVPCLPTITFVAICFAGASRVDTFRHDGQNSEDSLSVSTFQTFLQTESSGSFALFATQRGYVAGGLSSRNSSSESFENTSRIDPSPMAHDVEIEQHSDKWRRIWQIFTVAGKSVGVFLIVAFAGGLLAYARVVSQEVKKALAYLTATIAMPCLFFTSILGCPSCRDGQSVCKSCDPVITKLMESAAVCVSPFVVVATGLVLGSALAVCLGVSGDSKRCCIACVAFGNSTGMPTMLLPVIFHFLRQTNLVSIEDPLPCLAAYLVLYAILQWTIGTWLFRVGKHEEVAGSGNKSIMRQTSTNEYLGQDTDCAKNTDETNSLQRITAQIIFYQVFQPCVVAIIAAIVVGSSPARGLLVDTTGRGGAVILHWIFAGLKILGQAAVPLNVMLLGATLFEDANATISTPSLKMSLAIAFFKLIVLPAIVFGIASMTSQSLFSSLPQSTRNTIRLVILLCSCTPTANSILLMATASGHDTRPIASALLLEYILAPFFITGWLTMIINSLQI